MFFEIQLHWQSETQGKLTSAIKYIKKTGNYGIKNVHIDDAIPAIIADIATAPIPVRAPFLKVIIRAKNNIITNQKPKATFTNTTIPSIIIFGITDKNENAVLTINGGTE